MNRKRKIIRNLIVIAGSGVLFCFFNGWYLSPQACIEDSLRGLYFDSSHKVMELSLGKQTYSVYDDPENQQLSIHGAERVGFFFYKTIGGTTHQPYGTQPDFDITGVGDDQMMMVLVHRNNPQIARIEADLENGNHVVLENWYRDFDGVLFETDAVYWSGIYCLYNQDGNLLKPCEQR